MRTDTTLCPGEGAEASVSFCSVMNEKRGGPPSGGPPSDGKRSQLGAAQYVLHPRAAPKGDEYEQRMQDRTAPRTLEKLDIGKG